MPLKPNTKTLKSYQFQSMLPTVEEPICVLRIEVDGQNYEEVKVFDNDNPYEIVNQFSENYNLSENAKKRLLD